MTLAPVPSLSSFSSPLNYLFLMGVSSLANKVHSRWGSRWVTANNRSVYGGPWLAARTQPIAFSTHTPHTLDRARPEPRLAWSKELLQGG